MSTHDAYRDAGTGRFVSAEYADQSPGTTVPVTFPEPDQLDIDLDWITQAIDSRPLCRFTVLGEHFEHTDPREASRLTRLHVERVTGQS